MNTELIHYTLILILTPDKNWFTDIEDKQLRYL